jgi:TPP-dependent pyruvate/acetoin dehydrogenase alpha subunit
MAALWDLPAVYVCENNLYAATTPATITLSPPDVAARAAAYDMPGFIVDGQDILAVFKIVSEAVARTRAGNGPTLVECKTYRFVSHAGGGQSAHNNPEELEVWKRKDPIALFERKLTGAGYLTAEERQTVISEARSEAREAVAYGKRSPYPEFEDMPVTSGVAL